MPDVRLFHGAVPARKPITLRTPSGYSLKFVELANGKVKLTIRRPGGSVLLRAALDKSESTRFLAWLPK